MLINSIVPYTGLIVNWLKKKGKRYKDHKKNVYNTKCTSISQFKDMYEMSDYVLHTKYASLLNTVFVTLMYGVSIPLLYPIGAFALMN
jgi:hypothetical protein